jgi:hypothetical protein
MAKKSRQKVVAETDGATGPPRMIVARGLVMFQIMLGDETMGAAIEVHTNPAGKFKGREKELTVALHPEMVAVLEKLKTLTGCTYDVASLTQTLIDRPARPPIVASPGRPGHA